MALEIPELSPRELATRFTDTDGYFVSEASVYRLIKSHDLIPSPAFVVIKAAEEFKDKTTATGTVARLVGIEGGVISGVTNLEHPALKHWTGDHAMTNVPRSLISRSLKQRLLPNFSTIGSIRSRPRCASVLGSSSKN